MRLPKIRFLPILLLLSLAGWAQNSSNNPQTITTATAGPGNCATIDASNLVTIGMQVTGTWSGTLQPEVAIGGQTPVNTQVTPSTSSTAQSTITANGLFYANVSGANTFLLCATALSSGTVSVYFQGSGKASRLGGGGGSGSGTVSANNGVTNVIATYAAAGGSTTVAPASSSSPSACLPGSTSGESCFTANAIAGTATNPVVMTNTIQGPAGSVTAPTYQVGTFSDGMSSAGPGAVLFSTNNSKGMLLQLTQLRIPLGAVFGWSNTASDASQALDTGLSRTAANVTAIGNGTAQDESGLLRWNTCKISSDVSLTVNTANSFCSFSLPAVAKTWAWMCDIQWTITAGTGTNTFALGVNASQTPTATTNGMAQIYTALTASTNTLSTAAISASGATSILTSPTYTPAATIQFAHASGTLAASATAGTFAVTATANGTTATAAVKAGSTCTLY